LLLSFSNSDCSERSQAVSCAACLRAIYSASVVDNATVRCFFDVHAIAASEWHTTHPEMDRRSSLSLPKSESEYTVSAFSVRL
ncbi:hypothetical protein T03_17758, partial [Trichinella britovi]